MKINYQNLILTTKSYQLKIVALLSFLLILLFTYQLDWQDLMTRCQQQSLQAQQLQQQLLEKQQNVKNHATDANELKSLQTTFLQWKKQLLVEKQSGEMLENINQLTQQTKVEIKELKPLAEEHKNLWLIKTFQLNLQGGYHQLAEFVIAVLKQPGLWLPVEFSWQRDNNQAEKIFLALTIKTYQLTKNV